MCNWPLTVPSPVSSPLLSAHHSWPVPHLTSLMPAGAKSTPAGAKSTPAGAKSTSAGAKSTPAGAKFAGHLTRCAVISQSLKVWAVSYYYYFKIFLDVTKQFITRQEQWWKLQKIYWCRANKYTFEDKILLLKQYTFIWKFCSTSNLTKLYPISYFFNYSWIHLRAYRAYRANFCWPYNFVYENRDMAIAMSSSRADPVLGLNIPSSCPGWGYLNI